MVRTRTLSCFWQCSGLVNTRIQVSAVSSSIPQITGPKLRGGSIWNTCLTPSPYPAQPSPAKPVLPILSKN